MDTTMVGQAYESYRQQLYGYLVSLTHNGDVAQDIVQETFARLALEVQQGRTPLQPRGWLYRVARNLVISRGRRQQVAERLQIRLIDDRLSASAEEQFLLHERKQELRGALAEAGSIDRKALLMAAAGYSAADIGGVVGLSESAVRTRLCRARSRLRERLKTSA